MATSKKRPRDTIQAQRESRARRVFSAAVFRNWVSGMVWQPALHFASTANGAPARCQRRACQQTGRCHISTDGPEPLSCGGGLADETLVEAARMATFCCLMVEQLLDEVASQIPAMAEAVATFLDGLSAEDRKFLKSVIQSAATGESVKQ